MGRSELPIGEDDVCDFEEYHNSNASASLWPEADEKIERYKRDLEARRVSEGPHRCCCKKDRPEKCKSLSGERLIKSSNPFKRQAFVCPRHMGYKLYWKVGHRRVPQQCSKERFGSEARRCCCRTENS